MGMEFSMPFGFRRGHAAVRNAQLQLARERAVLDEQEREVMLGLSNAIAEVERAWGVAQTNYNRRASARQRYAAVEAAFEADKVNLDLVLDAQRRMSEADTRYFATLAEYALAIKNVHFEKGSLLDLNEVYLAEGPWPGKAYDDAEKRSHRGRAIWPLNYIFKAGPVISAGPLPQQTSTVIQPAPEVIPLPEPEAAFLPATAEPSASSELPATNRGAASVMVSDTTSTPHDRANAVGKTAQRQGGMRRALRSAMWPPSHE